MPYQPMDLGRTLAQAENIQGSRLRNLQIRDAMDPNSPQNQLLQLQMEARRLDNEAKRNPAQLTGFQPVPGLDGYVGQRGPKGGYHNLTNTTPSPDKYHFGFTGVEGDPALRQPVAINTRTLESQVIGDPYAQRAQVEINNGGATAPPPLTGEPPNTPTITPPWANIRDPKVQANAQLKFGEKADEEIIRLQTEADPLIKMSAKLDRFIFLNQTNETGGFTGNAVTSTIRQPFDAEFSEMASIINEITPQMRQGMPGAASDRDVAMFKGATVGVNKPLEANQNIAKAVQVAAQNKRDQVAFFEDYRLNNGHVVGAKKAWREYLEANPIFDPNTKKGSYKLNETRLSYQEHFGGQQQVAPDMGPLSDAELDALIERLSQ